MNEFDNFLVGPRFLTSELVTGKGQNRKVVVLVLFVQCTQTCVLGSEASFTRDVDDQANPAFIVGERNALAGDRVHFEIVHTGHGVLLFE